MVESLILLPLLCLVIYLAIPEKSSPEVVELTRVTEMLVRILGKLQTTTWIDADILEWWKTKR